MKSAQKSPDDDYSVLEGQADDGHDAFWHPDVAADAHEPSTAHLELRVLRALRRIIQAVDVHSRKLASEYQITGPQLVALWCIVEEGPITPSNIAARIHLRSSTVVGILDRLESKGLIERRRGREDRRHVYVSATESGRQLTERAPSPLQDTLSEALAKLPSLEQTAIALSLERIVELIDAGHLDATPVLDAGPLKNLLQDGENSNGK